VEDAEPALRGDSTDTVPAVADGVSVLTEQEAVERWWSELPRHDRDQALHLAEGVDLPEEFWVGLLLSGFPLAQRPAGRPGAPPPEAVRHLIARENAWRRTPGVVDVEPARSPPRRVRR
jgi:hypothetical protein